MKGQAILVTGAAGFIGMHSALALRELGYTVVGMDNMNDYYDINLKLARLAKLDGIEFHRADICDLEFLKKLFTKHKFTHVLNLAAQAGVRFSIDNPYTYIQNNVMGFVTLLEAIKEYNQGKLTPDSPANISCALVYASSSSVYGRNEKSPFSVEDDINQLSSLYAATKKSNEDIAQVYHHLYKIPVTGLRFFTVYGPYGRPDMAVFGFTELIKKGLPVKVYDNGELLRDFTYIADIVTGIVRSIELRAEYEIFNLGKGHPNSVNELLACIEHQLGVSAVKNYLPMQPGDVPNTFADITHTQQRLNYTPSTTLEQGVKLFCDWYSEFYPPSY